MFIFKVLLTVIVMLIVQDGANAQKTEAYVTVVDKATKIEKKYPIGSSAFSFQLPEAKGWSKCTVNPMNIFTHYGRQRMRVDAFCFTNQGVAVLFSCHTAKNDIDVTINTLLGTNAVVTARGESHSDSVTDIILTCSYF
jgi:hypothetical protein